jgi:hypothetical protein
MAGPVDGASVEEAVTVVEVEEEEEEERPTRGS